MAFVPEHTETFNSNMAEPDFSWLDYLVVSNPQGLMRVLSANGYNGYLAPQGGEELREASFDFIEKEGDKGLIELLKSHPLYDLIKKSCEEPIPVSVPFKNATGETSSIITNLKTVNYKKLIETILVIIGAVYIANSVWGKLSKTE